MKHGTVYQEGRLSEVTSGELSEDMEVSDSRTTRLCREVANTILPNSVIMEEDSPSKHSEGKIPILDMEMWVNMEGYIIYQHYSKPMSSRSVIMARSAFPTSMKKNILLEEGSRRLRNCSPTLPWTTKVEFMNKLCIYKYG